MLSDVICVTHYDGGCAELSNMKGILSASGRTRTAEAYKPARSSLQLKNVKFSVTWLVVKHAIPPNAMSWMGAKCSSHVQEILYDQDFVVARLCRGRRVAHDPN